MESSRQLVFLRGRDFRFNRRDRIRCHILLGKSVGTAISDHPSYIIRDIYAQPHVVSSLDYDLQIQGDHPETSAPNILVNRTQRSVLS